MTPGAVAIVGHQNSGKTRLVTRLVRHFIRMGLRVGTLKHASHGFDVPGKDSHAHFLAGAAVAILVARDRTAVFRRERASSLSRLLRTHFRDVDLVLIEGFHRGDVPCIEVRRRGARPPATARGVVAIVSEDDPSAGVPRFRPREIGRIARFIQRECEFGK